MAEPSRHILGSYDSAIAVLQNDLLMMASLCERNLRNSLGCLLNRDEDLCNVTIADDEEIDQLEIQIDKNGIDLLRRFQPVATDLRHVVAAMKLAGNLERIADQGVNIARKARKLNRAPLLPEVHYLDPMYREVTQMLSDALRSYTDNDIDVAIAIPARDKKLDAMNHEITEKLTVQMTKFPERIAEYLELIFIARHLERSGDLVKNIAEDVVFAIAAQDIRHMGAQRPGSAADLLGDKAIETAAWKTGDTLPS
jgi:phosphate transport system protein